LSPPSKPDLRSPTDGRTSAARAVVLERLAVIVGTQGLITDARDMEPYVTDWRQVYRGVTPAVVRPASTAEVAAVMKLCAETGTPVVPQGGNTGMCGGATPSASGKEIVIALGRMNRILETDVLNNTMTVEAGCILANIQQAAFAADRSCGIAGWGIALSLWSNPFAAGVKPAA